MQKILLKDILKKVRQLEIKTKGLVNNIFGGEYRSAFKGKGMTFSEVREYQYGDDVRAIDWNVSAKKQETYIKVFEEEREQTMMILFDASGSGEFGTVNQFKRELAAEICSTLAFSAIKNNDKVGLIIFTDEIEKIVVPRKGRSHVLRILREIYFYTPKGKKTNIKKACEFTRKILKRKSIVFLVSDLMDINYENELKLLKRKHDFLVIQITDPKEKTLPANIGYAELVDAETGEVMVVDTYDNFFLKVYTDKIKEKEQDLEHELKKNRIDRVVVSTAEPFIKPLTTFFRNRNFKH